MPGIPRPQPISKPAPSKPAPSKPAPGKPLVPAPSSFVKAPPSKGPTAPPPKPPSHSVPQPAARPPASKPASQANGAPPATKSSPIPPPPSKTVPSTAKPPSVVVPPRSAAPIKVSTPAKVNPAAGGPLPLPLAPSHDDLAELEIDHHAAHIAAHQAAANMHTEHALIKIGSVVNVAQSVAKNPAALGQITSIASLVASAATVAGIPGAAKAAQAVDKANAVVAQVTNAVAPAATQAQGSTSPQDPGQAAPMVNGVDHAIPAAEQGMVNGALALDGGVGDGAGVTDSYDVAPDEGTWNIAALTDDEKHASATAGTEDDLYHINAQDESHIERLEDHSGLPHDVAIVAPTCTFLAHMSHLTTIPFFKEVAEAAPAPAFYQFAVVGTPHQLKPLTNYATEDTRDWDNITDELKKAIRDELHLVLRIAYGHRPTLKSWAELEESYTIMSAFGMDTPAINEVVNAGIAAESADLGRDLVEFPAAFLNLGWALKNRKIFLEALAQISGRLVYHGETEKTDGSSPLSSVVALYPNLAEAEPLVTKYVMSLHQRVEKLLQLMSAFLWPSIVETFKVTSKKTAFKKARDPTPIMIRADLSLGKLIEAMKDYRDYLSGELGRNGRGGGYTNLSGRDESGGRKKFDWFTELPIAEEDAEDGAPGVPFAEFTSDFAAFE